MGWQAAGWSRERRTCFPVTASIRPTRRHQKSAADDMFEKMFQLQQKKQLVFEGTVDGTSASLNKLTAEDLAFLFHS